MLQEQRVWNKSLRKDKVARQTQLQGQEKKQKKSWQENYEDAWRILFKFSGLTDRHIKLIIDCDGSEEADVGRAAVIKIYTYETDLYKILNHALQTKDKSKIKTLGPYACLLRISLG